MSTKNHRSQPDSGVLVVQRGARHRYMIPRLLHESGKLAALYTDSSQHSLFGKMASCLMKIGLGHARIKALAARTIEGIPPNKVHSFDLISNHPNSDGLAQKYKEAGLKNSSIVYSMCGEEFSFLCWAKEQGCTIVVDVFVHPGTERIVEEENVNYLGEARNPNELIEAEEAHFIRIFKLADILLCPSGWVAEGVQQYAPECADKIRLLPYGSSLHLASGINKEPVVGRILFAGRDPLRKGLHYLADAARICREQGLEIEVRVAGITQEEISWMENRDELHCVGTLPMKQMKSEFRQADVFVLPSLSEGQAGVLLEAMASGCPVIATRESGVDFEPECGVEIPARNAEALADAISSVVRDRSRRNKLAEGALRQASGFSVEAWKSRLTSVIEEVEEGRDGNS